MTGRASRAIVFCLVSARGAVITSTREPSTIGNRLSGTAAVTNPAPTVRAEAADSTTAPVIPVEPPITKA